MKDRMSNWALVCKVFGWICMIVGALAIFKAYFITLVLLPVGLVLLLNCAIFEWMDGVTAQLIESKEVQAKQLAVLERIEDKLMRAETTTPTDDPPHDAETGAGRRRAQRQTESEVVEQAQQGFDPQNVADMYRLSQKLRK
ncbi:MAG: hypothetical protein ACI4MM_08595 [Candidatus Ventricola sp.]